MMNAITKENVAPVLPWRGARDGFRAEVMEALLAGSADVAADESAAFALDSTGPWHALISSAILPPEKKMILAFSGGLDSALISVAIAETGRDLPKLFLTSSSGGRDDVLVEAARASLDCHYDTVRVDHEDVIDCIRRHAGLLSSLPDYTQRILAVCELFLGENSEGYDGIVTGHGPEAVLGGFHRRAVAAVDRPDEMAERLFLNLDRLDKVARATGKEFVLPLISPAMLTELIKWRRRGLEKNDLVEFLPDSYRLPEIKSSLQNGSGIHYLFVRAVKAAGHRYTRDYMEELIR